jgi:hypothetical protein
MAFSFCKSRMEGKASGGQVGRLVLLLFVYLFFFFSFIYSLPSSLEPSILFYSFLRLPAFPVGKSTIAWTTGSVRFRVLVDGSIYG